MSRQIRISAYKVMVSTIKRSMDVNSQTRWGGRSWWASASLFELQIYWANTWYSSSSIFWWNHFLFHYQR